MCVLPDTHMFNFRKVDSAIIVRQQDPPLVNAFSSLSWPLPSYFKIMVSTKSPFNCR